MRFPPQNTMLHMLRSLGQSWPQSTTSLQSQEHCLTVTAAVPAGASSSDEDSSSSLLSTFITEFVARERLAAARREPESSCVSAFLTPTRSLVCRRAPAAGQGPILYTCPKAIATAVPGTGECFAPPPHPSPSHQHREPAKICSFLKAGVQQIRLSQNIPDTSFCKALQANTSHISCTRDPSPLWTEGTAFPDQPTGPSLTHGTGLALLAQHTPGTSQKVLHSGQQEVPKASSQQQHPSLPKER